MELQDNPYEPPRPEGQRETEYDATELTRLSFAEIWRIIRPWHLSLGVMVTKVLGGTITSRGGCAYDAAQSIAMRDVPAEAMAACERTLRELPALGFRACFAQTVLCLGDNEGYAVHHLHEERRMWATAIWTRSGSHCEHGAVVASRTEDDCIFSTTSLRRALNAPPEVRPVYLPGADPAELVHRHRERLAAGGEESFVRLDEEGLRASILQLGKRITAYNRARGVFRRMTHDEVEKAKRANAYRT